MAIDWQFFEFKSKGFLKTVYKRCLLKKALLNLSAFFHKYMNEVHLNNVNSTK